MKADPESSPKPKLESLQETVVESETQTLTAVDYINEQDDLEKEARELMPYDPEECTYDKGELRQPVFACLTCSRTNNNTPIGVCYSCSIQCHSSHELVELFSRRNFVCDCGTTKMAKSLNGACKLRIKRKESETTLFRPRTGSSSSHQRSFSFGSQSNLDLPAEDIPGSNSYNQNFKGLFCSCEKPYNPLEETGNMLQCFFGFECGEDWYHESCILGYQANVSEEKTSISIKEPGTGENILDKLPEPGEEALLDDSILSHNDTHNSTDTPEAFPELDDFDVLICWKCVLKFPTVFSELKNHSDLVLMTLPHFDGVKLAEEWKKLYQNYLSKDSDEPPAKKPKLEKKETTLETFFLKHGFKQKLKGLKDTSSSQVQNFLLNNDYLYESDPVYEPPQEQDQSSTSGSLLDLGTEALLTLPREKAVEGLQAYDKIRSKLRDFFKPFAEQGKVVTEQEVREFFSKEGKDRQ